MDPTHTTLDIGTIAASAAFATLVGGGLGALAGVNVQGAATAAQNEALNNAVQDWEKEEQANEHSFTHNILPQGGPVDEEQAGENLVVGKGTPLAGMPNATNSGTTTLYRVVGPAELADIQATGVFQNLGSAEGKYFTTSSAAASSYAQQAVSAFGDPAYTTITTQIPNSILNGIEPVTVDGGIPAYVIPNNLLSGLKPSISGSMAIPGAK